MTKQEALLIKIDERTKRMDVVLFGKDGNSGLLKDIINISDRVLQIETSRKTWGMVIGFALSAMLVAQGFIAMYFTCLK